MRKRSLLLCLSLIGLSRNAGASDDPSAPATVGIESAGRPQRVELARVDALSGPAASCETPCTLTLAPGRYSLMARGRGVRSFQGALDVPTSGTNVRLLAPSKGAFVTGVVLTAFGGVGTALMGAYTAAILASGPSDGYNQSAALTAGGMTLLVPLPCLIIGLRLLLPSLNRGYETTATPSTPAELSF